MPDDREGQNVARVLAVVDTYLPSTFEADADPSVLGTMLGVAAVRHAANLLGGEAELGAAGRWSVTRLLGRAVTESWLWANLLFLDGDAAVEQLIAEDVNHQHRLKLGHEAIWDRLESKRPGGVDLRTATQVPSGDWTHPNIRDRAQRVRVVREEHGLGGGIADVAYEMIYRYESTHDVHIGFDLLGRYLGDFSASRGTVVAQPGPEDIDAFRGPEALLQDARLVADAVGVYLKAYGRATELDAAKAAFGRLD